MAASKAFTVDIGFIRECGQVVEDQFGVDQVHGVCSASVIAAS